MASIEIPEISLNDQIKIAGLLSKAEVLVQERKKNVALLDDFLKSTFLKMFGDPVLNPKKYKLSNLGELGIWQSGGTPLRKNLRFFDGKIPWLTSGELNELYVGDSKEKISSEAIESSNAKIIDVGSLLLGMYDTAALKSSITTCPVTCNQAIAYAKLNPELSNTVYVYFSIQIGKNYFKRHQRGVRQQNMNLSMIKSIKIMLPEIEKQNQFAEIVQKTELLKAQLKNSLIELEDLYGSLSQRGFKKELNLSSLSLYADEEEYQYFTNDRTEPHHFAPTTYTVKKEDEREIKEGGATNINWERLANRVIGRYKGFYFNFEMLLNFIKKEKLADSLNYYSSEELKGDPKLNDTEDIKSFTQTAVQNVLMDEDQQRKTNPFLTLKQCFYNAENENFPLDLHKDDYNLIKNKTLRLRSGIFFKIVIEK